MVCGNILNLHNLFLHNQHQQAVPQTFRLVLVLNLGDLEERSGLLV